MEERQLHAGATNGEYQFIYNFDLLSLYNITLLITDISDNSNTELLCFQDIDLYVIYVSKMKISPPELH